jgi:hypothetical protein
MANSSINLVDLDFNGIKTSFKNHLKSQAKFQDYNFDGSNISVLLDVLAYNTYLNTFYLNMVASEMFLDSAQLRDSVVSHAKELNYLPRSFRSAIANVNISITPSTPVLSVVIPGKSTFSSRLGSNTFTFTLPSDVAITESTNGVFTATGVSLYEGVYVSDTFIRNSSATNQRYVLTNPNIDTTSIEVSVSENSGANVYIYTQAFSLFGLNSNSSVFFVQPCENEQYELVFGDDTYGRAPRNGAVIGISYRTCNGELPNGVDNFVNNSSIDGHANVSITVNTEAINGSISESISSIKYNAPRNFQIQERAITENDYSNLLTREFPDIEAISVYGGEKEDPPQYGKIFISVKSGNFDVIPEGKKLSYKNFLLDKVPLGFTPEIVSPSYVYLRVNSTVKFNPKVTTLNSEQIKTKVLSSIVQYNSTYLNDFNSDFRYSNFVTDIDNSDNSILNNDTDVNPYIIFVPELNTEYKTTLFFNAPVLVTTPSTNNHPIVSDAGVTSTPFIYGGLTCQLEDDGEGHIRIIKVTNTEHIEVKEVGTIDYPSGTISISGFNIDSFTGNGIKLYVQLSSKDYSSSLQRLLKINPEDVAVTMVPVLK